MSIQKKETNDSRMNATFLGLRARSSDRCLVRGPCAPTGQRGATDRQHQMNEIASGSCTRRALRQIHLWRKGHFWIFVEADY